MTDNEDALRHRELATRSRTTEVQFTSIHKDVEIASIALLFRNDLENVLLEKQDERINRKNMKYLMIKIGLLLLVSTFLFGEVSQEMVDRRKIVFLGNALVEDCDWSALTGRNDIKNAGFRDFTSHQLGWVFSHSVVNYKPDYCLIYSGFEDLLLEVPHAVILNNYKKLCDRLQMSEIMPIVNSTIYYHKNQQVNAKLEILNKDLKEYCIANGITFLDINEKLQRSGTKIWQTGLNLTNQAYEIWGKAINQTIDQLDNNSQSKPKLDYATLSKHRIKRILEASPETVNIVMLGNSITENGGDWNSKLSRDDVRNSGQGGYTTGQMLWHIDTTVVQANPKVCFIMEGINDFSLQIPVYTIYKNYLKIIEILKQNNITPIVQSTLYQKDNLSGNRNVKKLNGKLLDFCNDNTIHYIDLNKTMSDERGLIADYTTDGTHLTEKGYAVWSKILKEFIKNNKQLLP